MAALAAPLIGGPAHRSVDEGAWDVRRSGRSAPRRRIDQAVSRVVVLVSLAVLAGCARHGASPAGRSLVEAMPGFQLVCSARGLRPGTEAFEGCVRERAAAWRGAGGVPGASGPPEAAGGKPGVAAGTECRLSPLGGYHCEQRPAP